MGPPPIVPGFPQVYGVYLTPSIMNLVGNPSIEINLANIINVGSPFSVTRDTGNHFFGTAAFLTTSQFTNDGVAFGGANTNSVIQVPAGATLRGSCYMKSVGGALTGGIYISQRNSDGTAHIAGDQTVQTATINVVSYTRLDTGAFTIDPTCQYVRLSVVCPATFQTVAGDGAMLTLGSTLYTYFDGNTTGAIWLGATNNSASSIPVSEASTVSLTPKTSFLRSLSISTSSAFSFIKGITKSFLVSDSTTISLQSPKTIRTAFSTTANNAVSIIKRALKPFAITSTGTPSYIKRGQLVRAITATSTVTSIKSVLKSFSVTEGNSITSSRLVNKSLSLSSTITLSMIKRAQKIILFASSIAASLTPQTISGLISQSLSVTVSSSLNMIRSARKVISYSSSTTSAFTNQVRKSVSLSITELVSIIKNVRTSMIASASSVINLLKGKIILVAVSATSSSQVVFVKRIGKRISSSISTSINLFRGLTQQLSTTVVGTPIISRMATITLRATNAVVSSIVRNIIRFVPAENTISLLKNITLINKLISFRTVSTSNTAINTLVDLIELTIACEHITIEVITHDDGNSDLYTISTIEEVQAVR